jgi:hypothetical protein
MAARWWRPKNEVERAMLAALRRGDTVGYLRLVATTDLYLPQLVDIDRDTERRSPITRELSGVTVVMVFSSPESMAIAVGDEADAFTKTSYPELRTQWPAPQWRLAVNGGTPIATFPTAAAIDRALQGGAFGDTGDDGSLPIFDPAMPRLLEVVEDDVDEQVEDLFGCLVTTPTRWQVRQPEDIMDAPWHLTSPPAGPTIEAFTTAETVAAAYPDLPNVRLPFPLLLSLLPEGTGLVVDPGGPAEIALRGDRLLLVVFRVNDRFPARDVTTTPRPPAWHLAPVDAVPMTAQVYGSPPPNDRSRRGDR